MSDYRSTLLQPRGAYVELNDLLALRHLAETLHKSSGISRAQLSGQHQSRDLSRGMEFEEVRQYQPGDDVRNIDWRVTARTQVVHSKRYRDEKEKPVITLVDQRRSLFFGSRYCFKSVYACHLAAFINWSTLQRRDRAGGIVIGSQAINDSRPSHNHSKLNRWLQLLTSQNCQLNSTDTHQEPTLSNGLQQLVQVGQTAADAIIITDAYDLNNDCEQWLFHLTRHYRISLYWLFDPLENQLPLMEQVTITNGIHKHVMGINKNQQQQHHQHFIQKQRQLQQICQQYRMRFIPVNISQPLSHWFFSNKTRAAPL